MTKKELPKVPDATKARFAEIVEIIGALCKEKLNDEYYGLATELTAKIARKRPSPLLSGSQKTWAAGIVHALGMVNFLFSKTESPHLSSKELREWFGLGESTINGKSKIIRKMFKMTYLHPVFCLPSRPYNKSKVWLVSSIGDQIIVRCSS